MVIDYKLPQAKKRKAKVVIVTCALNYLLKLKCYYVYRTRIELFV